MAAHGKQEELCVIVNEMNEVVGSATRSRTVSGRLLGRGAYCLVVNDQRELLVSARSLSKDVYPGLLDTVISGVCQVGEEYLDTAIRELIEELGLDESQKKALLSKDTLSTLGIFPYQDDYCHVFGCAFLYRHSGPIRLQEEEVDSAQWMPLSAVEDLLLRGAEDSRFTPVGKHILQTYIDRIRDD